MDSGNHKMPQSSSLLLTADVCEFGGGSYRKLESKSTESSLCDEDCGTRVVEGRPEASGNRADPLAEFLPQAGRPDRSEYLPDHVENPYYAPEPPSRFIPGCFPDDDGGGEWSEICLDSPVPGETSGDKQEPEKSNAKLASWMSRSSAVLNDQSANRRQSLDTIALGVKEILSQGMMKLNISSLTERRGSDPKMPHLLCRKAPSPLDRTLNYLTPEEDSASSDSESLASVEMLSDEQISSLMLDNEIQQTYNDILAVSNEKVLTNKNN